MSDCRFTIFFFRPYYITTVTPFIRRNQGWSLRSGRVLDQSQQKCHFFAEILVCCKFFQIQPKRETSFSSLRDRLEKTFIISPSKLKHFCRTSRHVWLSSSACDRCCAYQLICIMTISTYTTGARAEMTRLLGSSQPMHPSCISLKDKLDLT